MGKSLRFRWYTIVALVYHRGAVMPAKRSQSMLICTMLKAVQPHLTSYRIAYIEAESFKVGLS